MVRARAARDQRGLDAGLANAIAAVSPAGPPPTIATSTVNGFAMAPFLTRLCGQDEGRKP
jgi:hypothetical protein